MRGQRQTGLAKSILSTVSYGNTVNSIVQAEKMVWLADWKKHKLPYCSVYIVSTDSKWPCKIGVSVAARKRLLQLQTSVWKPLEVAGCYWCKTVQDAKALEKKMHETLTADGSWLLGEWFDMRPDDVPSLLEFNASVIGVEVFKTVKESDVIQDIEKMYSRYTSQTVEYARIEAQETKRWAYSN